MRPMIDHGLLSPSGRVSKRAHKATLAREMARCFGGENRVTWAEACPGPVQPSRAESLRRTATNLRTLAAGGMKPRAYPKEAARLEAEADALDATS